MYSVTTGHSPVRAPLNSGLVLLLCRLTDDDDGQSREGCGFAGSDPHYILTFSLNSYGYGPAYLLRILVGTCIQRHRK